MRGPASRLPEVGKGRRWGRVAEGIPRGKRRSTSSTRADLCWASSHAYSPPVHAHGCAHLHVYVCESVLVCVPEMHTHVMCAHAHVRDVRVRVLVCVHESLCVHAHVDAGGRVCTLTSIHACAHVCVRWVGCTSGAASVCYYA